MTTRTKSIALITLSCTLIACDKEPEIKPANAPQKETEKIVPKVKKKLSPFEQEIQKMLNRQEGDEAVLRAFLKGKPKENNRMYLREGVDYYVSQHNKKPNKRGIIKVLHTLNFLNEKIRGEIALEKIKQQLSDQLKREQKE